MRWLMPLFAILALAAGSAWANDKLDNTSCLTCHDGKKDKINSVEKEGKTHTLSPINPEKYGKGVHAKMECVACHKDITDSAAPHKRAAAPLKVDCAGCHEELWNAATAEQKAAKPGLALAFQNVESYKNSFHARPNKEDKSRVNATCNDCHDTHTFLVPPKDTLQRAAWRLSTPSLCGEKCHTDELEDYKGSIHGKETQEKGNLKAAVCVDCHTTHAIGNTSSDPTKVVITNNCGGCHEDRLKSYQATYHGQVSKLGYGYTAKCFDCHGSHDIVRASDPKSKVHEKNLLKTCRQCHNGKKDLPEATAGFATFGPHANAHEYEKYPQMWWASRFMIGLLIFVFAYFWLHSLLWWYREYKDRKEGKGHHSHIQADQALKDTGGTMKTHFERFSWPWRVGHLVLLSVTMTLVLTGVTVLYADSAWAPVVSKLFGGPKTMGLVHRIAATGFIGVFLVHLAGLIWNIGRNWKTFDFFGPDSLVPRWKDLDDAYGMFIWMLGKGPRPTFDRWTYWEKFDYWAVFWGLTIIGGSGLMLAFPHVTASIFPGWIFNVATLVHGEEAFLCAVFLFTVHFFNNHFRPDKWPPPDVVMFTGVQSLDEFRREHSEQYKRLLASGELDKYLVPAPTRKFSLGAKVLGLTLITIGLTELALVTIGFFSGH